MRGQGYFDKRNGVPGRGSDNESECKEVGIMTMAKWWDHGMRVVLLLVALSLSACASTLRYVSNPSPLPPDLGVSSGTEELNVSLNYVIVPNGSGAWVKGARWDEYILTIRNFSDKPLTIKRIQLIDSRGIYVEGTNPYSQVAILLAESIKNRGNEPWIDPMMARELPWLIMTAPLIVVGGGVFWLIDSKKREHREKIEKELTRREQGLALFRSPLAGNATITGSVFFPIVPNPKTLVINYQWQDEMKTLEVSLEKLASLHIVPE